MTSKEALEILINNYKEFCDDYGSNDIEYQLNNLTSPYHIIKKDLSNYEFLKDIMRRLIVLKDSKELIKQNKERLKEILLDEEGRTN